MKYTYTNRRLIPGGKTNSPHQRVARRLISLRDGRAVVKVEKSLQGTRGLYSGAMELALFLSDRPEIDRACLVLTTSRLSMDRLRREWTNIKGLFHPAPLRRLSMVALGKDDVRVEPDEEFFRRIAKTFQAARGNAPDTVPVIIKPHAKQKQLEVLKVLLHRWLLREGAVSIGKLAKQVGCSYPNGERGVGKTRTTAKHRSTFEPFRRACQVSAKRLE